MGKILLPPFLSLLREQKSLLTVWMGQEKCYPSQDLKIKFKCFVLNQFQNHVLLNFQAMIQIFSIQHLGFRIQN